MKKEGSSPSALYWIFSIVSALNKAQTDLKNDKEDELGGEEVAERTNETTLCETREKQKRLNVYTVEWIETEEERGK